jgi:hypothetical protein
VSAFQHTPCCVCGRASLLHRALQPERALAFACAQCMSAADVWLFSVAHWYLQVLGSRAPRAALVDKDRAPRWAPAALADVRDADVDTLFGPLPDGQALRREYYL